MKRIIKVVLSVLVLLPLGIITNAEEKPTYSNTTVFDSMDEIYVLEEWPKEFIVIMENDESLRTGAVKFVYIDTFYETRSYWGYHPDFSTWQYCDGYFLSTTASWFPSMSVSVNIYGAFSITVAKIRFIR